ncbi:hypothetical protein LDENG_00200880 [Lucifuga dentata]|nr:hypothetical protein LDENG_00200880 [Lucifuga dentata]
MLLLLVPLCDPDGSLYVAEFIFIHATPINLSDVHTPGKCAAKTLVGAQSLSKTESLEEFYHIIKYLRIH